MKLAIFGQRISIILTKENDDCEKKSISDLPMPRIQTEPLKKQTNKSAQRVRQAVGCMCRIKMEIIMANAVIKRS